MRNYVHFLSTTLIQCFLIFSAICIQVHTKSTIEACNSSNPCPSLLSYLLPRDSMLSEIATRFNVTVSDIMAANSAFPITASRAHEILKAKSRVRIPIKCPCVDGIQRSMSTVYTVKAADTVDSISDGYGRLVSGDQIKSVNGINATNPLEDGERIVVPLPCTCMNNVNNGGAAVYMSYVVERGESLGSVAAEFGTTVTDLETVNGFAQDEVDPGDILSVPIAACSSTPLNWYDESLIVPNGSYTLTATNCIKCTCAPLDLKMQCLPSRMDVPCFNLRCKGSNLIIGDEHVKHSKAGCNVTQCVYRGHRGGKIFSSVVNSSYLQCPDNQSYGVASSCWPPSSSPNPTEPLFAMSPSPSPSQSPFALPVSEAALRIRFSDEWLGLFSFIIYAMQLLLPKFIL